MFDVKEVKNAGVMHGVSRDISEFRDAVGWGVRNPVLLG